MTRTNGLCVFILLISLTTSANRELNTESTQEIGPYTVHYSVFNSLFILPDIAKHYGLTRAKNRALINITIQKTDTGKAIPVAILGQAKNLLQQHKTLSFKEINEADAVYYLASLKTGNEEVFHFDITFSENNQAKHTLSFTRKLYVEK